MCFSSPRFVRAEAATVRMGGAVSVRSVSNNDRRAYVHIRNPPVRMDVHAVSQASRSHCVISFQPRIHSDHQMEVSERRRYDDRRQLGGTHRFAPPEHVEVDRVQDQRRDSATGWTQFSALLRPLTSLVRSSFDGDMAKGSDGASPRHAQPRTRRR